MTGSSSPAEAPTPRAPFHYRDGQLHLEDVSLATLAARHGTPLYVYSRAALRDAYREFADAVPGGQVAIHYAVKANSNIAVLDVLAREGAGFDIVSGGELQRALTAGAEPSRIVFSGVGKQVAEMQAALRAGVRCFNIESLAEMHRLDEVARSLGMRAPVSIRVNPDVDARTHPYISTGLRENKFGIAHDEALAAYRTAASLPGLEVIGLDCHIGSQITTLEPFLEALDRLLDLLRGLWREGIAIAHLDLGGGLGIRYRDESPPARAELVRAVHRRMGERLGQEAGRLSLWFEFGRAIAGPAGALLTRVEYLKPTSARRFAIVDAAMNDLLRPSLYDAHHDVLPLRPRDEATGHWDLVGPICESGDWLARDRALALHPGDLLALTEAGAYGMAMSSNYNSRARAAEIMIDGKQAWVIRERETFAHQIAGEHCLPR
ncbi:MAG: diaminopimelate decarboxylase [Burkholderiaceae bacterium]